MRTPFSKDARRGIENRMGRSRNWGQIFGQCPRHSTAQRQNATFWGVALTEQLHNIRCTFIIGQVCKSFRHLSIAARISGSFCVRTLGITNDTPPFPLRVILKSNLS